MIMMHKMGTSFIGKERDLRQIADAQNGGGGGGILQFQKQVNGHEMNEKASRIQAGSLRVAAGRQIRKRQTHPTLTRFLFV